MKAKKWKKTIIPFFMIALAILTVLVFSVSTAFANSQIMVSFDPRSNEPPSQPINPYPRNKSTNIEIPVTLRVDVFDDISSTVDVYFYNALNDSLIGIDYNVSADWSTATVIWNGLQKGTSYSWYAVANDSEYENTSQTWIFTTKPSYRPSPPITPPPNQNPIANLTGPLIGYDETNAHADCGSQPGAAV